MRSLISQSLWEDSGQHSASVLIICFRAWCSGFPYQTESVGAIMGQEVEQESKYLLDDCNEALMKIKMVISGLRVVDMTEDQLVVSKNTITLLMMPNPNWGPEDYEDKPLPKQGHHQAHIDDITLRTATDTFQIYDLNDPFDGVSPLGGTFRLSTKFR
ncbi:hypothetical protein B0H14DRAFT_2564186 [Mycena olivaceomarginata]|nr:hypothetical protein B0H14DRAFT_2564186 [Mycena olivaceomarginata]